jgi:hypothetical protein
MPSPSQSDLHINAPLTNVSVAYMQSASSYVADKIFPRVPVLKQSDVFWKYSKSDWRRTSVARRAPGTESKGAGWTLNTDNYFAEVYAVHHDVDDQKRANADSNFKLDSEATQFVTNQLLLSREVDWHNRFFRRGVWATERVGGTDFTVFSDVASDPIGYMATQVIAFRKLTGFSPNICVMGADVMVALKQHPDIIDRIKYTQKGIVTEDLIASLWEIDEVYTSYATISDGPDIPDAVAQDAAATNRFITDPKAILMAYAPSGPSLMTPSAGYTFNWKGYLGGNAQGIRIKNFRMEELEADRIEGSMTYDMKVVSADCGLFLAGAVA